MAWHSQLRKGACHVYLCKRIYLGLGGNERRQGVLPIGSWGKYRSYLSQHCTWAVSQETGHHIIWSECNITEPILYDCVTRVGAVDTDHGLPQESWTTLLATHLQKQEREGDEREEDSLGPSQS